MRAFVQAVHDASAIHGELKRMLLAAGITALIALVCWAIQEWGARHSQAALGWRGGLCMGLVFFGGAALTVLGLL